MDVGEKFGCIGENLDPGCVCKIENWICVVRKKVLPL